MSYTRIPLESTPASVRHARQATTRWLHHVGRSAAEYRATVVVSELVTNAIVHARGPVALHLWNQRDRVKVGVSDGSTELACNRSPDAAASSGRGLHLVEGCASRWGSEVDGAGKITWAEISIGT
jgi:anti-sigma regulatory factor (Ser/Thr protein kinase)